MDDLLNQGTTGLETLVHVTPDWLSAATILLSALALALVLHWVLHRILTRIATPHDLFWRSLVARAVNILRLGLVVAALAVATPIAPLPERVAGLVNQGLLIGFILLLIWLAQISLHIFTTLHLRRFELDTEDNLLARKHVTQSRILQRIATMLILMLGTGAILMTFPTVRQYGVSILASAGAAGLVVGLALQPMLKNIIAGIQLAVTQPIRIDDALIIEGEFGNVEEITSTYVVVRTWDLRRLIVPLNYFMENPFQNWTREEARLIGAVLLYVDFSVPVAVLREKAQEIVHNSPLWDGEVFGLQVTDLRDTTMEVRVLASAANAGHAWDMRCDLRERLVTFLAENYPGSLPRFRTETELHRNTVNRPQHSEEGRP